MRSLLSCLLVALVLSGCSTPADDEPEVDEAALNEGLAALFLGDHPAKDDTSGTCFADALLATTSPQELQEAGLLDEEYAVVADLPALEDDALAGKVADAQLECTDYFAAAADAQASISKGKLDGDAFADCLRDTVDDEQLRAAVVATLQAQWDDPALSVLTDAQRECNADG